MKGIVYWITGLSGAGKTTIGTKLYYRIREQSPQTVLLDGDIVKLVFEENGHDYSKEGRKKRAYQYSRLCKMLSDQGITVICCTIAMFDEVRQWNRENIENYIEVYVKVDFETVKKRNVKGVYETSLQDAIVDEQWDLPKTPDILIENTLDNRISEYVNEILAFSQKENTPTDCKEYWNSYYFKNAAPTDASDFANYVLSYINQKGKLIDLGCGNGRDSIFFMNNGLRVTAVDSSQTAIKKINDMELPIFAVCDDFTKAKALFCVDYDYCYSRWTLHAIDEAAQDNLFSSVFQALKKDGLFLIEARTVQDPKYGMGEPKGKDEFLFEGHYRRFLRVEEVIAELKKQGFSILYSEESNQFSVQGTDKPCLVRIVAQKSKIQNT